MRRENRLVREADFARLFAQGKAWVHPLLVLRALPNELNLVRFGFSVSKRVGNAVTRNRVRRLMREAARLTAVRDGWDIVLIARKPAAAASFQQIRQAVRDLVRRAGLTGREPLDRLPASLERGAAPRRDEDTSALADSLISDDDIPRHATFLPFHSHLFSIRIRGGLAARVPAGRMDDDAAHCALPSVSAWRVRSGPVSVGGEDCKT
ncbi:MAG: ribonuclease P protein component [Chloroflexota bacterium]|nr:MAG: ribonuclease P protein component [Chloroflexota bacterium]